MGIANQVQKLFSKVPLESQLKVLRAYDDENKANGCNENTRYNYMHIPIKLALFTNKDFKDITKEDLIKFVNSYSARSVTTKNEYKVRIKKFFEWLRRENITKWIKREGGAKRRKRELIEEEEIKKLMQSANTLRDKAIVGALYETGIRQIELCNIRLKDVKLYPNYALITITNAKRGRVKGIADETRTLPIIRFFPELTMWLKSHPYKDSEENALFPTTTPRGGYINEKMQQIGNLIRRIWKRTNINKNISPHIFRHTYITNLYKNPKLTDAQRKILCGWDQDTDMAEIYVHIKSEDVARQLLEQANLVKAEERQEPAVTKEPNYQPCINCNFLNDINKGNFCNNCGTSLTAIKKETNQDIRNFKLLITKDIREEIGVEITQLIEKKIMDAVMKKIKTLV